MNTLPDFATEILKPILDRNAHSQRMAGSLALIITELLNEHEPLLKAVREDNGEITVTEKGGSLVFTISVEPGMPGTRAMRERRVTEQAGPIAAELNERVRDD